MAQPPIEGPMTRLTEGANEGGQEIDLSTKTPLNEKELARKKEGFYITGAAGPGSSPDVGVGGSVLALLYWNGARQEPLFSYTPYKHNMAIVFSYMSKGFINAGLFWDAPYFMGSPFRLYAELQAVIIPVMPYYGVGVRTMEPLSHPDGSPYESYQLYESDLRKVEQGNTMSHYNYYDLKKYFSDLFIQRDIAGGAVRLLGGFKFAQYQISDYSSRRVSYKLDGQEITATMGDTRLKNDFEAGNISGFEGGWNNSLALGAAYDTRDLESYPRSGMFHDITFLYYTPALGSATAYSATSLALRFYTSPFSFADLVFAARLNLAYKEGDIPFYAYSPIQYTDREYTFMGGMRGYMGGRFAGPHTAIANVEMRYRFWSVSGKKSEFDFALAPFADFIRIDDTPQQLRLTGFAISYGAGLRIVWNQATVIVVDYGVSSESHGLYLTVRQIF